MATLQKRKSRGKTYWSIVESRRVNGKPRPVIVAYLGRAEDLLKRLNEGIPQSVKSYSHGFVAMLLQIAEELQVVESINRHLPEENKQLRDGFTVGGSLLLAAIGRACKPRWLYRRGFFASGRHRKSLQTYKQRKLVPGFRPTYFLGLFIEDVSFKTR
jgi:hypothetical protein